MNAGRTSRCTHCTGERRRSIRCLRRLSGLVDGGDFIKKDVLGFRLPGSCSGGGTIIGTARSEAFRTPEGRRAAARNMIQNGIDGLVVIGGRWVSHRRESVPPGMAIHCG